MSERFDARVSDDISLNMRTKGTRLAVFEIIPVFNQCWYTYNVASEMFSIQTIPDLDSNQAPRWLKIASKYDEVRIKSPVSI